MRARLTSRLRSFLEPKSPSRAGGNLTREHVVWAYRLFLDREPESEECIDRWLSARSDPRLLRSHFLSSPEFRRKNPGSPGVQHRNCVVLKEIHRGLRIFVDLADIEIGLNVLYGSYEPNERAFIEDVVQPGQVVFDLGANIGFFTLTMASLVGPEGHVYAFEPIPANADLLRRSIAENDFDDRVVLFQAAAGSGPGEATIVSLDIEKARNSGGAYLVDDQGVIPPEHDVTEVKVLGLDSLDLHRPVAFIKADVEGAEALAFRGGREILRSDRPIILTEINPLQLRAVSKVSPPELVSTMAELGYSCHLLEGRSPGPPVLRVPEETLSSAVFIPES